MEVNYNTYNQSIYAGPDWKTSPEIITETETITPTQVLYAAPSVEQTEYVVTPTQVLYAAPVIEETEVTTPSVISTPSTPTISSNQSKTKISITLSDVKNNITVLNESVSSLREKWSKIKNESLNNISSSWAGSDCNAYIQKINEMDTSMNNSFEALELLSNTYQDALNSITSTQENIKNTINNL